MDDATHRPRPRVLRGLTLAALLGGAACSASLPLGGIAPGRGQPIGRGAEVVMGYEPHVELAGTLPEVFEVGGALVNPIPTGDSLRTPAAALDVGLAVAFADGFDVGLSRSRGLHATVRLLGGPAWAWSVSPALFYHRTDGGDLLGSNEPARVVNRNLSTLVSVTPDIGQAVMLELYAGGGYSHFDTALGRDERERSGSGTARSVVVGTRLGPRRPRVVRREPAESRVLFGVEGTGAWIRQRDGRTDFVPTVRLSVSLGLASRRGEGPPHR